MTRAGFLHPLLSPRQYRSRNSANQAYPVIQHAETIRVRRNGSLSVDFCFHVTQQEVSD